MVAQSRRQRWVELLPEEGSFYCRSASNSFDMGEIVLAVGLDGSEASIVDRPCQLLPVPKNRSLPWLIHWHSRDLVSSQRLAVVLVMKARTLRMSLPGAGD